MRNLTITIKGIKEDTLSSEVGLAFAELAKQGWKTNANKVTIDLICDTKGGKS